RHLVAGGGPPDQAGADGHDLVERPLEVQGQDGGSDLHHAYPEGDADGVRVEVDDALAFARAREVDLGGDLAGAEGVDDPGRGPEPDLDVVHGVARELQVHGKVL